MKCLILAAGYATRLYPLTENFPKPLLEVGKKTIIDYLLDDLSALKIIDEYIIVTNHKFYHFFKEYADKKDLNIKVVDDLTESNEDRLGAVKDIEYGLNKTSEDDVIVMAGDNILDFSLKGFVEFALEKDTSCVMSHVENDLKKKQKTAIITIDENNVITSYEEKPKEPKSNLAVPPFYFYKKDDIKRIAEALNDGCNKDAPGSFAAWLSYKTKMHAYIMPGKRHDIGDLKSLEEARELFK